MAAPTKYPDWATDGANAVEPPAGKVAAGWLPGEQPPAGWFNWWKNIVGAWTRWLDSQVVSLTGRVGTLETGATALDTRVDALEAEWTSDDAELADVAHKNQSNTFTQPQTIAASGDALLVTGHILTSAGSIEAYGVGGSLTANADVNAGANVIADVGEFKYKTARTRTTFVPLFGGYGNAVLSGGSGVQASPNAYKLRFTAVGAPAGEHVFPIVLPHGAVLTACEVLVYLAAAATVRIQLNRRRNHNFEWVFGSGPQTTLDQVLVGEMTWGLGPGVARMGVSGLPITINNDAADAASNGSEYLLSVIAGAINDEIHAIRVVWTDPGPRNV